MADSTPLTIGFQDSWDDVDGLRHVATPDDAQRLLARRGPSWKTRYGVALEGERAQFRTAQAIGVPADQLCVRVQLVRARPPGSLKRRWYGTHPEMMLRHRGPKLAIAAVYAAPMQPTEFDLERLAAFGYDGVIDVAQRIAEWNSNPENPTLPVPLSF